MLNSNFKSWLLCCVAISLTVTSCQPHYTLIKQARAEYHIDSSLVVDSGILKSYQPYKQKMDAQMNTIIGESSQELTKSYDLPETLLGNFFADAVFTEAKKIDPSIDFAMPTTKGGLRNNLPKGNIRLSTIFELMPFENELVVLKLSGRDVLQLLNFIAQAGGEPVAALKMQIKNSEPQEITINGKPFEVAKTYSVLTSDYIAAGGDNSKGMANPIEKRVLNLKVRDALIAYVKAQTATGKKIDATLDGRITKN
ncbi:5'-nucleotidase C-terminal domain-containing protein [Mucilaginibacter sp. UYNi724]|uniref:5'-Nucleotidase C-terminal domain-containing protein n=2 Tax=Mucilaginibacter gilvus TaxID=2305909 RepID=A0A444MI48_9SPHI|nr:hypothetical protein EPL05_21875 [Mucilaginibacter gilvus]